MQQKVCQELISGLSIQQFWAEVGRLAAKPDYLTEARASFEVWARRVAGIVKGREGKLYV